MMKLGTYAGKIFEPGTHSIDFMRGEICACIFCAWRHERDAVAWIGEDRVVVDSNVEAAQSAELAHDEGTCKRDEVAL